MKKFRFQRIIQGTSLATFIVLLVLVGFPISKQFAGKALGIFLLFDPLSAIVTSIAARAVIATMLVGVAIAVITVFFGRIFCGYICPMGATNDIFDAVRHRENKTLPKLNRIKYIFLALILSAAVFGVNIAFHLLPISLSTRFYGLMLFPMTSTVIDAVVAIIQNFSDLLSYTTVALRRYSTILFIAALFATLFFAPLSSKRFWCRYLCPTGALLGILSIFAPYRRIVSDGCTKCGKCTRACPTGAIRNHSDYDVKECISCKLCAEICPTEAISFSLGKPDIFDECGAPITRREIMTAVAVGGGLSLISMSELTSLLSPGREHGDIMYAGLIRPPGALPEKEFLAKCIRCGECMVACPTNAIQPISTQSGSAALFSPVLVPRRGNCVAECNKCGQICPTDAIQAISLEEKQHAKIGTARVVKERCLAWEENKSCVVCQEVCPYTAIKLNPESGKSVTVPDVDESRCFGCGACEFSCPLAVPAIVIEHTGEIRIRSSQDYVATSQALGLNLTVSSTHTIIDNDPNDDLPPGFVF